MQHTSLLEKYRFSVNRKNRINGSVPFSVAQIGHETVRSDFLGINFDFEPGFKGAFSYKNFCKAKLKVSEV